MDDLIKILSSYGFPGAMMAVAIFFIYRMQDINKQERDEWRAQVSEQHKELVNITKDTHTILAEIRVMISRK
jgi:hypothetical protein